MSVKENSFIFRKRHRRLTILSNLAIAPLFLTLLISALLSFSDLAPAVILLEYVLLAPAWLQALMWLVLPLVAIVLARRGADHGTLHTLRGWNRFTYRLAVLLLALELVLILTQLL
jgi:uncharacterized membrane protein YdfJ with MMPL/SSD domain